MTPYSCMSTAELSWEYATVLDDYDQLKAQGLKLNMARGKPSKKQLDLVSGVLTAMGIRPDRAEWALRFSLSPHTTIEEIDDAAEKLGAIYATLKRFKRR